jgi:hypothetical protein
MERGYEEFVSVVARFGETLPNPLLYQPTHLDPDFDRLTYGDQGQRAKRIATLRAGDLLAFFAGLRRVDGLPRPLVYALIGLYVIDEIVPAKTIPKSRWRENAHTRRVQRSTRSMGWTRHQKRVYPPKRSTARVSKCANVLPMVSGTAPRPDRRK